MRTTPASSSRTAAASRSSGSAFFPRSLLFAGAVASCLAVSPVRAQEPTGTLDPEISRTHPALSFFIGSSSTITRILGRSVTPVKQEGDLVFSPYSQSYVHGTVYDDGTVVMDGVEVSLMDRSDLTRLVESGIGSSDARAHEFERHSCIAFTSRGVDACRESIADAHDEEYDSCIAANEHRAAGFTGDTDFVTVQEECLDGIVARHPAALLQAVELSAPLRPQN